MSEYTSNYLMACPPGHYRLRRAVENPKPSRRRSMPHFFEREKFPAGTRFEVEEDKHPRDNGAFASFFQLRLTRPGQRLGDYIQENRNPEQVAAIFRFLEPIEDDVGCVLSDAAGDYIDPVDILKRLVDDAAFTVDIEDVRAAFEGIQRDREREEREDAEKEQQAEADDEDR